MNRLQVFVAEVTLIAACALIWSVAQGIEADLFEAEEPIVAVIELNMDRLCRNPEKQDCQDLPAMLTYRAEDGEEVAVGMLIRIRGRWGEKTGGCGFPSVFLFFDEQDTPGTIFEGREMMPLTTHCKSRAGYAAYVLKEYYAHRAFQLLTPKSVGSRLLQVTYKDTQGESKSIIRYAFLTEHFRSVARRNHARILDTVPFDPAEAEPYALAVHDLFQFMIGNTDWSVIFGHNRLLLEGEDGLYPVPYDLDFSGLVNAQYASPSPKLRIRNVRQRLFRGFCREDIDWDAVFGLFQSRRNALFELLDRIPGLNERKKKSVALYLKSFFRILDSPELRNKRILQACRDLPAVKRHNEGKNVSGSVGSHGPVIRHLSAAASSPVDSEVL